MSSFERFQVIDRELASHGIPPCSEWWQSEVARFYGSRSRTWAARVGRGGRKSTMLAKLALCEVLSGSFRVPPGERHFFAIISTNKDEAAQRLRQLEAFLAALGIGYSRVADQIDLSERPRGFKVLAATIAAASGFRCLGVAGDEVAKWRSSDDAANPAAEVAASMRAMTVTHARARMLFFSSPLSGTDWHSSLIDAGDGPGRIASTAPTWIATDNQITEEQTRELEPDPRLHAREYGAVPQAAKLAAFDEGDIEAAFEPRGDLGRAEQRVLVTDASSGKKDRWTWALLGWSESDHGPSLVIDELGGFDAAVVRELGGSDEIVARLCAKATGRDVWKICADQRESMALGAAFRRGGVSFIELPWTASSKPRAVARVRRWLIERRLALPRHEVMRKELMSFEEKIDSSGAFTFGARGSGHDDYVSLLITAALADEVGHLVGSPSRAPSLGIHIGGAPLRSWERRSALHVADRLGMTATGLRLLSPAELRRRARVVGGF